MIRKLKKSDTERIMEIWLKGNEQAHFFIPEDYWRSNFSSVREQLFQADVFVYEHEEDIQGFIGIVDGGYIAGIFVDSKYRSLGVGKSLLQYVKRIYPVLSLDVYIKNRRATDFYLREGFSVASEKLDEQTGESEYVMIWDEQ